MRSANTATSGKAESPAPRAAQKKNKNWRRSLQKKSKPIKQAAGCVGWRCVHVILSTRYSPRHSSSTDPTACCDVQTQHCIPIFQCTIKHNILTVKNKSLLNHLEILDTPFFLCLLPPLCCHVLSGFGCCRRDH